MTSSSQKLHQSPPENHQDEHTDEILQWIMKNEADEIITEMGHTIFDPGGQSFVDSVYHSSSEEIKKYRESGLALLQEPLVSGILKDEDLNMAWVTEDTQILKTEGLKFLIESRTAKLRWKGASSQLIQTEARLYEHKEALVDLLSNGVRSFTKPDFRPNGGEGYRQSKSYRDNRECCNWHTFNLREKGQAVIIPWSELSATERMAIHVNTWILAPATGKPNGRCCLNGSAKIKKQHSLNTGMDLEKSDSVYPPTRLPTLSDICEMAQQAKTRAERGSERVVGAVVDVAGAYNQITLSYEAALHRTVMIYIGPNQIPHLCIILVNNFGDARAGHVYNIAGSFIDHHHNLPSEEGERRSETYIDDGVMISPESKIEKARTDYRRAVTLPFGLAGIEPKKDKFMEEDLVCLGWHFNLRKSVWRVGPKKRAIEKIFAYLYLILPIDITDEDKEIRVPRRTLHTIASLLSWYSAVLRIGKPFVHSIFKNLGWGPPNQMIVVNVDCKRDLEMWRVISLASMKNPHLMSAKINHLCPARRADLVLTADASKLIGGGAWLSESVIRTDSSVNPDVTGSVNTEGLMFEGAVVSDEASGEILRQGCIRWTKEELELFSIGIPDNHGHMTPISINVLEYFVVMHFVLLWGDELKGKTIAVNCDNTAAVSWLLKMRGSNKSPVAESLVKLFTLFCSSMDITLLPLHLRGDTNIHADNLSRLLMYQEAPTARTDTREDSWWIGLPREAICRQLLEASVVKPSSMPLRRVLMLLNALL